MIMRIACGVAVAVALTSGVYAGGGILSSNGGIIKNGTMVFGEAWGVPVKYKTKSAAKRACTKYKNYKTNKHVIWEAIIQGQAALPPGGKTKKFSKEILECGRKGKTNHYYAYRSAKIHFD